MKDRLSRWLWSDNRATDPDRLNRRLDRARIIFDDQLRRLRGPGGVTHPYLEITPGTWSGSLPIRDADGRYLGEAHGLPFGARTHGSIVLKPFKGRGSRRDRPYNAPALRQVVRAWPSIIADVTRLRAAVIERFERAAGPLSWVDLFVSAHVATSIPAFLHRRADDRARDGTLAAGLSGLFKVMAGVHFGVAGLFQDEQPDPMAPADPDHLFDFLERSGLFISEHGAVCAGPERMIRELLRVAVTGASNDGSAGAMASVPHLDRAVRYGIGVARIALHVRLEDALNAMYLSPILPAQVTPRDFVGLQSALRALHAAQPNVFTGAERSVDLFDRALINTELVDEAPGLPARHPLPAVEPTQARLDRRLRTASVPNAITQGLSRMMVRRQAVVPVLETMHGDLRRRLGLPPIAVPPAIVQQAEELGLTRLVRAHLGPVLSPAQSNDGARPAPSAGSPRLSL